MLRHEGRVLLEAAPSPERGTGKAIMKQALEDFSKRDQVTGFMTKAALFENVTAVLQAERPAASRSAIAVFSTAPMIPLWRARSLLNAFTSAASSVTAKT